MTEPLIKTKIRGREIIFYLTSKNDLETIKSNNIIADVLLVFFSVFAGGVVSIFLAKELSSNLSPETISRLNTFVIIFSIIAVVLFIFYLLFTILSFRSINGIIASGKITSINIDTKEAIEDEKFADNSKGLQIKEALYYTDKISLDVTKKLQEVVKENTLICFANNDIDYDPHPGSPKKLRLKYSYDNVVYVKEYGEGDPIRLP